ncbi:MAG: YggS family pyridoxal phosphate-dependent enzyme [Gammaproteobacteria bacterium]|nr:YggS family pyridoxal phosphate-dependent enzyme [Gammaproteobacteria bacterium]
MPLIPLQRLREVELRVRTAEKRFGREPGSVQILPVSKAQPTADIAGLAEAGINAFGESYLQEAVDKIAALQSHHLQWHFLGPVQSNKTQCIARHFQWVHSVSREKIARRLNEQRPIDLPRMNVCLQLNVSDESSKSGVSVDRLQALAERVHSLPRLHLRGLMAIPARSSDFAQQRAVFCRVRAASEALSAEGFVLDTLSMGMSDDLEAAIAEGATVVRVGTGIFGSRYRQRANDAPDNSLPNTLWHNRNHYEQN